MSKDTKAVSDSRSDETHLLILDLLQENILRVQVPAERKLKTTFTLTKLQT